MYPRSPGSTTAGICPAPFSQAAQPRHLPSHLAPLPFRMLTNFCKDSRALSLPVACKSGLWQNNCTCLHHSPCSSRRGVTNGLGCHYVSLCPTPSEDPILPGQGHNPVIQDEAREAVQEGPGGPRARGTNAKDCRYST